jgi:hypothetical protein
LICGNDAPFRYLRSTIVSTISGISIDEDVLVHDTLLVLFFFFFFAFESDPRWQMQDESGGGDGHDVDATSERRRVELFPQQPTPLAANGLFELVGRLSLPRSWYTVLLFVNIPKKQYDFVCFVATGRWVMSAVMSFAFRYISVVLKRRWFVNNFEQRNVCCFTFPHLSTVRFENMFCTSATL